MKVSADRDRLRYQLQENEPVYKDVMDKEHEVIMMLDKGHELAKQSTNVKDAKAIQKLLDQIRSDWNKLRQETVNRHRRLQTCMELCRKYDASQQTLLPWLDQAEDKLRNMKPVAFKKSDLDIQVKELQAFRNEMSRHSAAFETSKSLGDSFLSACDVDKEGVTDELATTKQRWEQMNHSLLERSQSLEDIGQRLSEFIELLRDSQHAMQRCEDRLSSHDALGAAARDSKLLDRVRTLLDEVCVLDTLLTHVLFLTHVLIRPGLPSGKGRGSRPALRVRISSRCRFAPFGCHAHPGPGRRVGSPLQRPPGAAGGSLQHIGDGLASRFSIQCNR